MNPWDNFRFRMSDEQWLKVAAPLSLPEAARAEIDFAIEEFRLFEAGEKAYKPQRTKKKIERVQANSKALLTALAALDVDSVRELIISGRVLTDELFQPPYNSAHIGELKHLSLTLERLDIWFGAALKRVTRKPTRNPENLCEFVAHLGRILRNHTGKKLTRSNKSPIPLFVDNVANLASPNGVGPGSVDEALKSAIKKERVSEKAAT
jgi:hypothetical protein